MSTPLLDQHDHQGHLTLHQTQGYLVLSSSTHPQTYPKLHQDTVVYPHHRALHHVVGD